MAPSLQSALSELSEEIAQRVFELVRVALVTEIGNLSLLAEPTPSPRLRPTISESTPRRAAGPTKASTKDVGKGGRLARRSSESIAGVLDDIAALLRKKPGPGSEEIQQTLGLARNEVARPIGLGLSTGVLRKTGEKRATKYSATAGGAAPTKAAGPKKRNRTRKAARAKAAAKVAGDESA